MVCVDLSISFFLFLHFQLLETFRQLFHNLLFVYCALIRHIYLQQNALRVSFIVETEHVFHWYSSKLGPVLKFNIHFDGEISPPQSTQQERSLRHLDLWRCEGRVQVVGHWLDISTGLIFVVVECDEHSPSMHIFSLFVGPRSLCFTLLDLLVGVPKCKSEQLFQIPGSLCYELLLALFELWAHFRLDSLLKLLVDYRHKEFVKMLPTEWACHSHLCQLFGALHADGVLAWNFHGLHDQLQTHWALIINKASSSCFANSWSFCSSLTSTWGKLIGNGILSCICSVCGFAALHFLFSFNYWGMKLF